MAWSAPPRTRRPVSAAAAGRAALLLPRFYCLLLPCGGSLAAGPGLRRGPSRAGHLGARVAGEKVAIKKITNAFENLVDARRTLREMKLLRYLQVGLPAKLLQCTPGLQGERSLAFLGGGGWRRRPDACRAARRGAGLHAERPGVPAGLHGADCVLSSCALLAAREHHCRARHHAPPQQGGVQRRVHCLRGKLRGVGGTALSVVE